MIKIKTNYGHKESDLKVCSIPSQHQTSLSLLKKVWLHQAIPLIVHLKKNFVQRNFHVMSMKNHLLLKRVDHNSHNFSY